MPDCRSRSKAYIIALPQEMLGVAETQNGPACKNPNVLFLFHMIMRRRRLTTWRQLFQDHAYPCGADRIGNRLDPTAEALAVAPFAPSQLVDIHDISTDRFGSLRRIQIHSP